MSFKNMSNRVQIVLDGLDSTKTKNKAPGRGSLMYKSSSDVSVPFFGYPFLVENTIYYTCSQGLKYYASKRYPDEMVSTVNKTQGFQVGSCEFNFSQVDSTPPIATLSKSNLEQALRGSSPTWASEQYLNKPFSSHLRLFSSSHYVFNVIFDPIIMCIDWVNLPFVRLSHYSLYSQLGLAEKGESQNVDIQCMRSNFSSYKKKLKLVGKWNVLKFRTYKIVKNDTSGCSQFNQFFLV